MEKTKTRSWREILKELCETSPHKKQEIANTIGFLTTRTIDRWISGQSNPQKPDFIRNLAVLSDEMREALKEAFPEAFPTSNQPIVYTEDATLPAKFFERVVKALAQVPFSSRRWTIWTLVSHQAIPQLDGDQVGLMLMYVTIVDKTLQFFEGAGNKGWTIRQVTQNTLNDSWLVHLVRAGHPAFIQSCALSEQVPSCFVESASIQSMGFFPLYRSGIASGGLLFCARQEDFFTPLRQALIEKYSYLFALAFADSDFTGIQHI